MNAGLLKSEIHWPLVIVVFLLGLLGIYNLHSSAASSDAQLYLSQLAVLGFGAVVMFGLVLFDYRVTEGVAYIGYGLVCILLVAVLVQGKVAMGAQRWLVLGPFTLQPSEPAKLAVILCLARYFSARKIPGNYSLRELIRPLNLSRPLAALLALFMAWKKPALADPMGELARWVRQRLQDSPISVGDLMWFRIFLILVLVGVCAGGIYILFRIERERALLDPWPLGFRRRLTIWWIVFSLALGLLLISNWNAAVIRDPFGVALTYLYAAAAPGGPYANLVEGFGLRFVLGLFVFVYLLAAGYFLRGRREPTSDLVIAPIDWLLVPAGLVLIEPDLGTSGIIILIGLGIIMVVGVRLRSLIILTGIGAFLAVIAWFGVLKDYQKRRILTFIDPEHDLQGAGWNAVQSMIAVGSGRWTGKGHLGGTQTQLSFLPEQHTDFAFSVWAEEQGFLGCLLVLMLFFILITFIFSIASQARDVYGALLAVGVGMLILCQAAINIGMVIGIFPVVGVTLPLFSYGGSSLLTVMAGLGLVLNVHWRRRGH